MCRNVGKTGMECVSLADFSGPGLAFSWRKALFVFRPCLEEEAAGLRRGGGRTTRRTRLAPLTSHGHTTGVLVFAGVKGNPFGGVLFNHVPFFSGAPI